MGALIMLMWYSSCPILPVCIHLRVHSLDLESVLYFIHHLYVSFCFEAFSASNVLLFALGVKPNNYLMMNIPKNYLITDQNTNCLYFK